MLSIQSSNQLSEFCEIQMFSAILSIKMGSSPRFVSFQFPVDVTRWFLCIAKNESYRLIQEVIHLVTDAV